MELVAIKGGENWLYYYDVLYKTQDKAWMSDDKGTACVFANVKICKEENGGCLTMKVL